MSNNLMRRHATVSSMKGIQNNPLLNQRPQQTVESKNIQRAILNQKPCDAKMDRGYMDKMFSRMSSSQPVQREEFWKGRTNQPYKTILPEKEFKKEFKTQEDLIVYKTNPDDKNKAKLEANLKTFSNDMSQHKQELKAKYTADKKQEFTKEFEYNSVEKYSIKYDQENFKDMKVNVIDYYKKEQQELEKDKQNVDSIIESMVANDNLDKESSQHEQPKTEVIDKYAQRQKKV